MSYKLIEFFILESLADDFRYHVELQLGSKHKVITLDDAIFRGYDLDDEPGIGWDLVGAAIVDAGEPYTTATGVHDFHEIPISAKKVGDVYIVGPVTARVWKIGGSPDVENPAGGFDHDSPEWEK